MSELARRLHMLLHRRQWRRELADEMRLHLELRGDPKRFGNELLLRERSRDMWGWRWLESLGQDARHGLRLLARTPAVTVLALVSLTLGIGANTALFSLMDAVLLRPLPVAHPEELVQLYLGPPHSPRPTATLTNPIWEQIRDHQTLFRGAFAWSSTQMNLAAGGETEMVASTYASGAYFSTLGVAAERGRLFGPSDDFRGCPLIADISDAFWRSHYAASPQALGAMLYLSGHAYQVVGVTPAGFFGMEPGLRFDVTLPLCTQAASERSMLDIRDAWWINIAARLPPGVTEQQAEAALPVLSRQVIEATVPPDYNAAEQQNYRSRVLSLQPGAQGLSLLRRRYGLPLEVLLGVAGFVLLVACANLAGLMLARAAARRQEIAVRLALGAGRARLVRQLLTESLLLALAGAGLGIGFALWACAALQQYLVVHLNLAPDARVLVFLAAVTAVTALLVGLAPALRATRLSLASQARQEAAPAGAGSRGLVAVQLALSLLLLAGAGMFLRSFVNLAGVPKGFDPSQIFIVSLRPPAHRLAAPALAAVQARDLAFLRALPGVTSVSESLMVPASGLQWDDELEAGASGQVHAASIADAYFNPISPGYFATLRTPLLSGRDFTPADRAGAEPVIILNQTAARALFPDGHAMGSFVHEGTGGTIPVPTRVVGVVADAKYTSLRAPDPPTGYYPMAQLPQPFLSTSYELRSPLPEATLTREVRAAFAANAPGDAFTLGSLERQLDGGIKPERLLAWLSALFGGLALLLTAIGLYGAAAYSANQRRREFGIRSALGARPAAILRLALGELGGVLGAGALAGVLAAWLAAHALQATLSGLLFQLSPTDLATLAAAALLLVAAALFAAFLPARRAARADPMLALREE